MTEDSTRQTAMSGPEFANLGLGDIAYIRPVAGDAGEVIGIFSADGTQVGHAHDAQHALALILQNDLQLVRVH